MPGTVMADLFVGGAIGISIGIANLCGERTGNGGDVLFRPPETASRQIYFRHENNLLESMGANEPVHSLSPVGRFETGGQRGWHRKGVGNRFAVFHARICLCLPPDIFIGNYGATLFLNQLPCAFLHLFSIATRGNHDDFDILSLGQ